MKLWLEGLAGCIASRGIEFAMQAADERLRREREPCLCCGDGPDRAFRAKGVWQALGAVFVFWGGVRMFEGSWPASTWGWIRQRKRSAIVSQTEMMNAGRPVLLQTCRGYVAQRKTG